MKKFAIGLSVLASLVMVGCVAPAQKSTAPKPTQTAQTAQAVTAPTTVQTHTHTSVQGNKVFDCQNGLQVVVKYLNDEQIALSSGNVSAILKLAPSGSGDRYVSGTGLWGNRGGEWHESGNIANFSYKGVHDSQVRQTSCEAQ